jgi:hypothetical protein
VTEKCKTVWVDQEPGEPGGRIRVHIPGCWPCVMSGLEFCTPACLCRSERLESLFTTQELLVQLRDLEEQAQMIRRALKRKGVK